MAPCLNGDKLVNRAARASRTHLTEDERAEIEVRHARRESVRQIPAALGRDSSTVYRELQWSVEPGERKYKAARAQKRYEKRREALNAHRRIDQGLTLRPYLEKRLREGWAPQLIAKELERERGEKVISHESIYQFVYKERRDLLPYLRLGGGKPAESSMPQQRSRSHIARKISKTEQTSKAKGGHHRRTPPCYPA